ncbi:uncharacterized protein LOC114258105 [Camellia sinensis]|uniref:uncharacterized protein LOC114258105 n=1 Tax=Camellia sinensis TaxID=4442 RepID=UPI001036E2E9|nr:uncharacterized protein LOC114258105 [Camellia sinensis]
MEGNGLMVNGPVEDSGDASVGIRNVYTGEVSGLANVRAKIRSQDDDISSSSSMCSKSPKLLKGLDSGMGKGGSKAPRISEKGKSKNKSQGQRVKNRKTRAQKGATLRAAVAAFSLASASHAGPSKGQIIQEDEVLKKIIELEQLDAERVEQRKKSKARSAWKIWTELLSWWGIIWVVPQSVSQLLERDGFKFKKLEKSIGVQFQLL